MSGTPTPHQLSQSSCSFAPKFNLIATLEKELEDIPEDAVNALSRKIYPVESVTPNVYNSLFRTLLNYFMIQGNKGQEYTRMAADIVRFASHISDLLMFKMAEILRREDVKNRLLESFDKTSCNLSTTKNLQNGGTKKIIQNSFQDTTCHKESSNKYGHLLDRGFKRENSNNIAVQNQDTGATVADRNMKEKSGIENLINRICAQKQLTETGKIGNKKCLVCDNLVVLNEHNRNKLAKNTFKCADCGEIFHKNCMQRENNCSFCQLRNINPLQRASTPLFLGILKKGTKRHELQFELSASHLNLQLSEFSQKYAGDHSTMPTIELRSIRMKGTVDPVSNFINLFPDACSLMINAKLIRQFEPLHKQSSLKYRRDECMKISSHLNIGHNKIVITERINKKDIKPDERIELDNHLVGVYIVQSLQVPRSTECTFDNFTRFLTVIGSTRSSFEQSESLLKQSLFIKDKGSLCQIEDQELVCDSVKVPLICSLTLQRMKFPGRSIFCKHFNCFDVQNFILLNAQAKLPKWQCPICKASAYKFQIDCVLSSILSELDKLSKQNVSRKNLKIQDNEKVAQVVLNRNFQLKLLNTQGRILISKGANREKNPQTSYLETEFVPFWIQNIRDLPVEGKSKRGREIGELEERSKQNRSNQSSSAASLTDQKPAQKYNEELIQRIVEAVEKRNIQPFIISFEGPNRAIQQKATPKNKQRHENTSDLSNTGEDKKPMPFKIRMSSLKQKQNQTNSPMKDGNQETGSKTKNSQCLDNIMADGQSLDANEQRRKLQFSDNSENSLKNFEDSSRQKIIDLKDEQKKVVESEENKVMGQGEQVKGQKNAQLFPLPSQIQKFDTHEEDAEMQQAFAQYQQNRYDKMKRIIESGTELPEVNTPLVTKNMDQTQQKELHQKQQQKLDNPSVFISPQPQFQQGILGNFDSSANKDNKSSGEFKQSQKQEIQENSHSQTLKPIAPQPKICKKNKNSSKQKQKLCKKFNNGLTSETLSKSKNASKMTTRKKGAKNAVLPNSKANQRKRAEKDAFVVPKSADIIELSE